MAWNFYNIMESKMTNKILFGLLFTAITTGGFAAETDGIYSFKVGQFDVHMLVERQNSGNAGILVNANENILRQLIPSGGFMHSTNAFLIVGQGQYILVDTGFGQTIFDKMKILGVTPEQITAVLLTHMHGDHIGGLQRDNRPLFPNAKLYLSTRERDHFTVTQVNQSAVAVVRAYGNQVVIFDPPALGSTLREILPGISPIANYGHTPGHTVYLVESSGSRLIIAGDFLHVALVQFPHPEISASYDMDQNAAAVSRRQLLEYAAHNRIPVGGMHIVYPGTGRVETSGQGFRFIPMQ